MTLPLLALWLSSIAASSGSADTVRPASPPQITGRVIDSSGKPLANVRVTDGKSLVARTGADGRFAFVMPDPPLHALSIESPAHAKRAVAVPQDSAPTLGDIALVRNGSVTVDLGELRGARELTLVRHGDKHAKPLVKSQPKRISTFERLEPAMYLLTVRGDGPLQQKSQIVELAEGETPRVTMTIDRMPLRGYVYYGREPLAGAEVEVNGPSGSWGGTLRADADGQFAAELWQVVPLKAVIRSPRLDAKFATGTRIENALEHGVVEWNIVIPDRKVTGRIVDDSGAAVAGATVTAESEDGEFRTRFNARTDANGAFRFGAARSGRYALDITSGAHIKPEAVAFELKDDDPDKHVDVVLQRGVEVRVRVTYNDGTPVAGATIADGITEDGTKPLVRHRTSEAGEATLRGRDGEEKTLYIVPPSGSFAIERVTLTAEARAEGVDVVVPDGRSALVIHTRDDNGGALDGIGFVVRYNGEVLPPAIMNILRQTQRADYRTTQAGEARIHGLPDGRYELWAYRLAREAERLIANPEGYEPSLELALAGGTYEATLTFSK